MTMDNETREGLTVQVAVRLYPSQRDRMKRIADREHRTLAQEIRRAIDDHISRHAA